MNHGTMPGTAQNHGMKPEVARDPIPNRGVIMLTLDNKEALSAISQILWLLCLALLAAVLITMSIAYVLVDRQILARLNLIRHAMTRQESVDRATQTSIGANDEISDLGRAFNKMIDRIGTETKRRESIVKKLLESEERFQSFAEIGSDWMWEMDADLRYSYFSEPTHRMTGLPQEHYLGKTKGEAGKGTADDAEWQKHMADLEAHRPFRDFCYSIADADDRTSHWSISGSPVFDADGEFKGYRGIGTDISERKATEEAMLVAMREAEIANRTKSEFLANMSHELRTPLNAIIGFSDIIKDERLGPIGSTKYRDYADDINESGQHLLALINTILDLSKIESGSDELREESIDISAIAHSISRLLMGLAQKNNIKLELDVPGDLPLLHADERKVKQILLNLLSNAIKFTPSGGTVTLKIWSRAKSGYIFQVIDTGIGIAFENIPRALAPFQQIDSGLNRQHEGTGLGLPLAKSLVELHGGYLDLQSEVGVGTTVTVRFPAERIALAPDAAKAASDDNRKAG
jgi:PAS domain S-box-containing protein